MLLCHNGMLFCMSRDMHSSFLTLQRYNISHPKTILFTSIDKLLTVGLQTIDKSSLKLHVRYKYHY